MELNICYIVGTALLYMNKLSLEDLEKISNKLRNKGYIINTSIDNIYVMLKEWRDFLVLDLDNNILLSDSAKESRYLVQLIFNSVLDQGTHSDILNSILYRNKQQSKIIKFK